MIYGYIRTSTDKQNNENQRFEIEQFANNNNLKIDHWIEETISSRKSLKNRKLGELLDKLNEGDILIATEISRLGRSLLEVMGILQTCLNKNCQVTPRSFSVIIISINPFDFIIAKLLQFDTQSITRI